MFIIKYRKIFFALSAILVALSVFFIFYEGLNFGIDFTGGSVLEVEYKEDVPAQDRVVEAVSTVLDGEILIRSTGQSGYSIRTPFLGEEKHKVLMEALSFGGSLSFEEKKFTSVGPVIGNELKRKAGIAILIVIVAIILYIAFVFRKVSKVVSSWTYGLVAIVALIHDVIIPFGVFALLGVIIGLEIDILFITALLAILGYSVNDTIVVFDRIRENIQINSESNKKEEFSNTVGRSLVQTFSRSISTSLTTALVLISLIIWGGEVTRPFALVLLVGVIAGTYSSLFLASPLLVSIYNWRNK